VKNFTAIYELGQVVLNTDICFQGVEGTHQTESEDAPFDFLIVLVGIITNLYKNSI
jgi:hypothetical protein